MRLNHLFESPQSDPMGENWDQRSFKRAELRHELRNEPPNNFQVVINGRPWKVFAGRSAPDSAGEQQQLRKLRAWAASKSAVTGKKWEVYLTGAPATNEGLRDPKDNPCWKGYKPVGTKEKNGRTVPNCVPKESVEESVRLSHARYMRSHGEKARGGYGNWMFTSKEYGEPSKDEIFTAPPGKFSDAAKLAAKWARANGHFTIYVMEGLTEGFNGEYDDEAGMAQSNLHTAARAVDGLLKTIQDNDNLPEWVQEKIAKAEMMLVGVWDYLLSQKEQGIDPKQHSGLGEGVIIGASDDGDPMNPQVAVLGGAGSYSLKGLYKKAEREAAELHMDIGQGKFRGSAYNIKQLANTLNTIVAAHEELESQRRGGGARSRGIERDVGNRE